MSLELKENGTGGVLGGWQTKKRLSSLRMDLAVQYWSPLLETLNTLARRPSCQSVQVGIVPEPLKQWE